MDLKEDIINTVETGRGCGFFPGSFVASLRGGINSTMIPLAVSSLLKEGKRPLEDSPNIDIFNDALGVLDSKDHFRDMRRDYFPDDDRDPMVGLAEWASMAVWLDDEFGAWDEGGGIASSIQYQIGQSTPPKNLTKVDSIFRMKKGTSDRGKIQRQSWAHLLTGLADQIVDKSELARHTLTGSEEEPENLADVIVKAATTQNRKLYDKCCKGEVDAEKVEPLVTYLQSLGIVVNA